MWCTVVAAVVFPYRLHSRHMYSSRRSIFSLLLFHLAVLYKFTMSPQIKKEFLPLSKNFKASASFFPVLKSFGASSRTRTCNLLHKKRHARRHVLKGENTQ